MEKKGINDETVEQYPTTCFISINEPAEEDQHYFRKEHPNVLTMYFHDVIDDGCYDVYLHGYDNETQEPIYRPLIFFSEEMAKIVLDFFENAKKNGCQSVLVHCTAGISRSGAVTTFAREFFGCPNYLTFKSENPQIIPNYTVLSRLRNEYEQRCTEIS